MRLKRETYLKQICPYDDSNVTKVITGETDRGDIFCKTIVIYG